MKVDFDPERHAFTVDGRRVPGVTSILTDAGLGVDYSRVPPATLAWARERGIHVDSCCELFDEGNLDWESIVDEARPYVEAWVRFREHFTTVHHKPISYHRELGYAGIPDVLGCMRGYNWILEIKATSEISRSYALQLAAYAMPGMEYGNGIVVDPASTRRGIVHLKKTGKAHFIPDDEEPFEATDFDVFRSAVQVARWKRNGKP